VLRNGITSRKIQIGNHKSQILIKSLKRKLNLKNLPSSLNGTLTTGTCLETNTMMKSKQSSKARQLVKLLLNKRLNPSLSSQLILQILWKRRKLISKRETSSNLLKLKLNSMLNSHKPLNSRLKLRQIRKSPTRSKLKLTLMLTKRRQLTLRKSLMPRLLKTKLDST